jgi:hypothetical protein
MFESGIPPPTTIKYSTEECREKVEEEENMLGKVIGKSSKVRRTKTNF